MLPCAERVKQTWKKKKINFFFGFTVVQVAGEGGMGEDEVVEVGVLLECWKISSSKCECPGGEVATRFWAAGGQQLSKEFNNTGEGWKAPTKHWTATSEAVGNTSSSLEADINSRWCYNILKALKR